MKMTYKIHFAGKWPVATPSVVSMVMKCPLQYTLRTFKPEVTGGMQSGSSATVLGTMLHKIFENQHELIKSIKDSTDLMYATLRMFDEEFIALFGEPCLNKVLSYMEEYQLACEETKAAGRQMYDKEYKYPAMTSHFKRKYEAKFKELFAQLNTYVEAAGLNINWFGNLLDFYKQGERCIQNYAKVAMKELTGCNAQYEVRLPVHYFRGFKSMPMAGTVDIITDKGIYDFKTGRKSWDGDELVRTPQLLWYAYLFWKTYGIIKEEICVFDLFNAKVEKRKLTEDMLKLFEEQISGVLEYKFMIDKKQLMHEAQTYKYIPNQMSTTDGYECPCSYESICPVLRKGDD